MMTATIYRSYLPEARKEAVRGRHFSMPIPISVGSLRWQKWAATTLIALAFSPSESTSLQRSSITSAFELPDTAHTALSQEPSVEPLLSAPLSKRDARTLNDETPFVALDADYPEPFFMVPQGADYARALDCLASALLYEAGDDQNGQAAVAQVVLNRVRHPAFPHSICAVVYQGADRATGCQFTFTCDGAMRRSPSPDVWRRARDTASAFLGGKTYPSVGMATHYHTDQVHPYWSSSLQKIAQTGPHLFFRWSGNWGRRAAFSAIYAGVEPFEPKLALLSIAHRSDFASPESAKSLPALPIRSTEPRITATREGDHFISIETSDDGSSLAIQSLGECQGLDYCKVVGWDHRSLGYGSPQDPIIRTVAFLYVSDKRTGVEIVLWDCTRFNRPIEAQCLSGSNRRWITFRGDLSDAS